MRDVVVFHTLNKTFIRCIDKHASKLAETLFNDVEAFMVSYRVDNCPVCDRHNPNFCKLPKK